VLSAGTTFIWDGHIWFNLTEPIKKNSQVLCVNLTTLDEDCPDDECPISRSKYNWVKTGHSTTVAFSRAKVWDANKIESALNNGTLKKPWQGNIPKTTIAKILKVAVNAKELSKDLKAFL
jgi:hypothetical protein